MEQDMASEQGRDAQWGSRMIEVSVRFWTDSIAAGEGKIIPKHAWTARMVHVKGNKSHDLSPGALQPFNSIAELPAAIEEALTQSGIQLHPSPKTRKWLAKG